jgi:hypothetical protein
MSKAQVLTRMNVQSRRRVCLIITSKTLTPEVRDHICRFLQGMVSCYKAEEREYAMDREVIPDRIGKSIDEIEVFIKEIRGV